MRNNEFMTKNAHNYEGGYNPNNPYNCNTGYADNTTDNRMNQYPNSYVNGGSEANLVNYSNDSGNNYSASNIPGNLISWTVNYGYEATIEKIYMFIIRIMVLFVLLSAFSPYLFLKIFNKINDYEGVAV